MLLAVAVISYLIGSIPTGFIFGKVLKGIDIRQHGSGNMGATNAFRILGKGPGSTVLALDIIKGILPVALVAGWLSPGVTGSIIAAVAVVCWHNWTCFLNFNGGKGVATSAGVLIGLTTEFFTSADYRPTQKLSETSLTGPATVIIGGLSLGMLSTVLPVIIIGTTIIASFGLAGGFENFNLGLYGIGIAHSQAA